MKTKQTPPRSGYSRRDFLKASGGLTFLVTAQALLPGCFSTAQNGEEESYELHSINAWVHIRTDGRITIYNPAAEMGQGSMTALAVLVAEELDADWADVHIEHSPVEPDIYGMDPGWGGGGKRMITVGSITVMNYFDSLRIAGVQARQILLENVAEKWQVPVSELITEASQVKHAGSGKKISYGEIAAFAQLPDNPPEITLEQLKSPDQYRLIGNVNVPRFDIPFKTNGTAEYSMDVQLPGMLHGMISRSPSHGAKPTLTNEAEIRAMPGVKEVVLLDHGVGVLADTISQALAAKKKLAITWSSAKADSHNSQQDMRRYPSIVSQQAGRGNELKKEGNVAQAMRQAAKTYRSDYFNDYVYHAQMEPLNAVVSIAEDGQSAEIWAGSQAPGRTKSAVAKVLGMEESQINFHQCYLGGGFGRRSLADFVEEAAHLAKAVSQPVKLMWTREDDVQYGAFRPMSLQRMQAGVDQDGMITAWNYQIAGPGGGLLGSGARVNYYDLPNQYVEVHGQDHGIRTKHWRSVGHGPNQFAIESFIDEIANDQGIDPYEYRHRLMRDFPRGQKVIETVKEMSGWDKPLPEGRARGISFGERSRSYGAMVCEISVDEQRGTIKVHHIWAALDAGTVVQPDNAIAQMEGAILHGLGSVLYERITFQDGKVQQSNFQDYHILRMRDVPDSLEVKLIPSSERPAGIGEAGLPLVAGAVGNAFSTLTGKRLRHLPFTAVRVKEVLG